MKVWDQNKSNCDLAYMASFWKENQLVQMKKRKEKRLKESSWFGEPKCKLRIKVAHFFVFSFFSLFSFNFVVQIM
jgi:hypothetical protein